MLSFLFSRTGAALVGIVAALALLTWSHTHAYRAGKAAERLDRLKSDIEAYQKREGIENEVDGMDRVRICAELGGLPDDCAQLVRRVEEAAGSE